MTESFAALFEESELNLNVEKGAVIQGVVVNIDSDWVTVDTGLKSEGIVDRAEFLNEQRELEVQVGDTVDVVVEALDNGMGQTVLSREKAKRAETWTKLEKIFEDGEIVTGVISGKVKGGFTVDIGPVRAFLPGSLVDTRPIRDTTHLEGKELEFKVIKLDAKRNNVVVSRRAVMEAESSADREALLAQLEEGQTVTGTIKNLTDYGAFVDLGGIDGLLHITDMAWKRIKHPSEVVEVGQEVTVKVLKFDRERNRVSLGLKQLGEDPWLAIMSRYPKGSIVKARVTNLTDYGCFAEIAEGVEGLVHVSEMDHTNKNIHPSKVVQIGDEVDVMVLEVDEERRRISLGIKQTRANPWEEFAKAHEKGEKVSGTIKSITDFGIFIGLNGGIDGLVHLSDISWNEQGEEAIRRYKKGDTVEAVILSVDAEGNRISLGIKQLNSDPFNDFLAANERGALVKGTVTAVDARGATVKLADEVEATLKASEINRDRVEDATKFLEVGQEVEAKIINVDRKSRSINLSIKAKDEAEEKEAVASLRTATTSQDNGPKTIGDLIKAQMK
ncbi:MULTISPECIES: 30S ribosomal protein S1 [Acinetobacter]|jgi:small subunit ribosomal protein S1|uniref:30S ribosomal protein S1 n=6 Tax=Acinetobacter TaxID=469 RepID=F0KMD7_ACIP2|nr:MULTISPECIES: 30S ribosomal protein S1 [Acinetobacter]YP_004995230.1 30S ribosomal protein S1 [Acinetobacter pittii PHEA-2]AMO40863.1 30S ribosomal protein S1 [Acinetobacter sp. DUT-2]KCY44219.1 ribosomal protein S1 [Acinetobacter baumannii 1288284]MDR0069078.1 30S ribosomal protein S1 [Acinetobacter sp. 11520]OBA13205.1 30S ribosomal protein S1 [Acinetobacter calcoaceticus]QNB02428.1 30S ribosomal protein S1 [Acinetobacter baumannii]TDM66175.1 30S ribosomal protein S1 [Acinetobacter sp. 